MYFLTSIEYETLDLDGNDFPRIYDSRCFGYFEDKDRAMQAVEENWGDMHECSYNFLVIESLGQGIHPDTTSDPGCENEIWFKWEGEPQPTDPFFGEWVKIKKPKWSDRIVNWAIG